MKKWTVGKRIAIIAGFLCVVIGIIVITAIVSVVKINTINKSISEDSLPGLIDAATLNGNQAEIFIRWYRLYNASTAEDRKNIQSQIDEYTKSNVECIKHYEEAIFSEDDRRNFDDFKLKREAYVKVRDQFLTLLEANREEARRCLDGPFTDMYKAYSAAGDKLMDYNTKEAQQRSKDLTALVNGTIMLLCVVGLISVVIGITSSFFGVRSVNSALKSISDVLNSNADQVASAAGQVSSSSQQLAEGASEQAASLEETSSSMEEMASIVQANANRAQGSKDLADKTRRTTTSNVEQVQQLKASVGDAQSSSQQLTDAMQAIKASSDSISKIIKTIDEIAFQTNILALNAAVEAARAGEAGMGFAVVADEVRNLAHRSAEAAKETASIIEDSIHKSESGVRINEEVVHKLGDIDEKSRHVEAGLKEILEKVGNVDDSMGEIATASREQTQGIGQVNTALNQMDKVTQSNAANAEETASAAEELNAQAEELKNTVGELLALVEGQHAGSIAKIAAATKPGAKRPAAKSRTSTKVIPMRDSARSSTTASTGTAAARISLESEGFEQPQTKPEAHEETFRNVPSQN